VQRRRWPWRQHMQRSMLLSLQQIKMLWLAF
jgi:hypothetical protein